MTELLMVEILRATWSRWKDVRTVRLSAMLDSPHAFGRTYEQEILLTEDDWAARFKTSAWFLAEDGNQVVGLAAGIQPDEASQNERHLASMSELVKHQLPVFVGNLSFQTSITSSMALTDGQK